jgi:chorismate dehydratase
MIRLGHIEYSNCFPLHAELIEHGDASIEIVRGIPSELNRALDAGQIDVAPASSIEYARHADRYRVLPDFVIGSFGAVHSILFETTRPIQDLAGARIAVTTASATSVALLKILLMLKYHINADYVWFKQEHNADPFRDGADGALWIGDVALRRTAASHHFVYDLGTEWTDWTNLPFAFAIWQTTLPPERSSELEPLLQSFHRSRARFAAEPAQMAERYAATFGLSAERLSRYWSTLRYEFDMPMQEGLLRYYGLAAQIGEAPLIQRIAWASQKARAEG